VVVAFVDRHRGPAVLLHESDLCLQIRLCLQGG
jgi:hypothetical protein